MPSSARVLGWAAGSIAAGALVACFDFDATMAGGPSVDGGGSIDAGDRDAIANDASDANQADASHAIDGGYCASIAPAAGTDAGTFFCDDFDDEILPGPWTQFGETGGAMTETDASPRSPPIAVDETTIPLADGGAIDVSLRRFEPMPTAPSTIRFAFSVMPIQIDPTTGAAIVLGAVDFFDTAGDRYTVSLAINVQNAQASIALGEQAGFVDGGSSFVNHPVAPSAPLAMNAWSDVVIAIALTSPSSGEATLLVNGTEALDVPLAIPLQASSIQIGIGTAYVSEPAPAWQLRYDDVVFTAR